MSVATIDWREVWERKGRAAVSSYELRTLIALDGFDGGAGTMTPAQFRRVARLVARTLGLGTGMRVLEVGCGAGALLSCLRETGAELLGIDYSPTLVDLARQAVPDATIEIAEADALPFTTDAVVCHSVFQYFPSYSYARRVLDGFARAAPVALILDVPDLATRAEAEAARAAAGSKPGSHLYYPRSFFTGGSVWTSSVEGYLNAPFRFNALMNFREPRA